MGDNEHSGDEKALPENKKRTVKTRAQVEALEQFYDEHKYPTESMKEEVAKAIGLTEKQVSGWFCHRRLKDKRLSNDAKAGGRQDRSSGIVQDRGSGFRQDSCGSTKQGDDRHFEPREVESRRLTCQESSAAEINYELGSRHLAMAKHCSPDDTSSGSSSSLRHTSFSYERDHFGVDVSRNHGQGLAIGVKEFKPRTGPSGYLKVKCQVENAAITAVKRQLGRHYRADGPPLGVEFDPLPPCAFESPIAEPHNGSYYAEESALAYSPEVVMGHRNHNSGPGYRYTSGISSHNSQMDSRSKKARGPDNPEAYYQEKFHTRSPKYNQNDFRPAKSSSTDIHEGSVKRNRVHESWESDQRTARDVGVMSLDSLSGHNQSNIYAAKINRKPSEPWLQNHKSKRPKVSTSDHYDSGRLNSTYKVFENDDSKYKGLFRRTPKETKSPGEKVAVNDSFDPVQPEVASKDEIFTVNYRSPTLSCSSSVIR
ncbi:OLC1v1000460C1 [Oldenlandia corymbosa var. corymbosa]|uniref:OLC1v1000460C1 n=1 Tax=Oldenlandia corymbosa var. corymbosa TaxID=529605 RepID=A0AAV1D2W1_OLDCO|nr:OLC1v1000460C1 [Oldenlandia corymbosa var. corymbosa]